MITDFQDINTDDNCTAKKHLYSNGANNTEVVFYEVIGGGHTKPSTAQRYANDFLGLVSQQNSEIEMATEVWNFFRAKSN